jgi:tRNA nucleotidyltransferase (CCA-adding enzyme)
MFPTSSDLIERFHRALPEAARSIVEIAVRVADSMELGLFLVGGPVRDLLLEHAGLDIDLGVEGGIEPFLEALEQSTGHRLVRHRRFGTATLRTDAVRLDFARTRREIYPRPGALPVVEPAEIQDDLARRDFSVNAMALRLTEPRGQLLDPFGGRADLQARLVRVLHDRSFQDDATRMLRAARYAARLKFEIEADTRELILRDLQSLDTVSGARLRGEMSRILREETAPEAVRILNELNVLARIHPLLGLRPRTTENHRSGVRAGDPLEAWRAALHGPHYAPVEQLGYCLVSNATTDGDVTSLSKRLHLTGSLERALRDAVRLKRLIDKLKSRDMRPSSVVEILEAFAPAAVWAVGVESRGVVKERCLTYLRDWQHLRPAMNGFDLQRLGVTGPLTGRALGRLRQALLDGEVATKSEEEDLIGREFVSGRQ